MNSMTRTWRRHCIAAGFLRGRLSKVFAPSRTSCPDFYETVPSSAGVMRFSRLVAFTASPCSTSINPSHGRLYLHTYRNTPNAPLPHVARRPRPQYWQLRRALHPVAVASHRDTRVQRVLQDDTVLVPSHLPRDKTRTVPVSMKTENLGGRLRRISGSVFIETSASRVWHVLTSYSRIESYMPNIVECTMLVRKGVTYLDQVGIISRKLMLRSRMLMRVSEDPQRHSVTFTRVEGRDFSEFEGVFFIKERDDGVLLQYELVAIPFPLFPMYLVERKIVKEVPKMLAAVREESLVGKNIPFVDERPRL